MEAHRAPGGWHSASNRMERFLQPRTRWVVSACRVGPGSVAELPGRGRPTADGEVMTLAHAAPSGLIGGTKASASLRARGMRLNRLRRGQKDVVSQSMRCGVQSKHSPALQLVGLGRFWHTVKARERQRLGRRGLCDSRLRRSCRRAVAAVLFVQQLLQSPVTNSAAFSVRQHRTAGWGGAGAAERAGAADAGRGAPVERLLLHQLVLHLRSPPDLMRRASLWRRTCQLRSRITADSRRHPQTPLGAGQGRLAEGSACRALGHSRF